MACAWGFGTAHRYGQLAGRFYTDTRDAERELRMTPAETGYLNLLIDFALTEDLGDGGDVTSRATIPDDLRGRAAFVARSDGVLAGVEAAARVCARVDHQIQFTPVRADGYRLGKGETFATVEGPMRSILTAERTALNFLQRLSGVATMTRRYVDAVAGLPVKILDTRKTTPGWRLLEKYAVRRGGGDNHRMGLDDGVLIKDNHLAALKHTGDPVAEAVRAARAQLGESGVVEVEVDHLDQIADAAGAGADIVLLDNMTPGQLAQAVAWRKQHWLLFGAVLLEASGGVNLDTVRAIA